MSDRFDILKSRIHLNSVLQTVSLSSPEPKRSIKKEEARKVVISRTRPNILRREERKSREETTSPSARSRFLIIKNREEKTKIDDIESTENVHSSSSSSSSSSSASIVSFPADILGGQGLDIQLKDEAETVTKSNDSPSSTKKVNKRVQNVSKSPLFICRICRTGFCTTKSYLRHFNVHLEKFKCDICHCCFESYFLLNVHRESHKPFSCDQCWKGFQNFQNLEKHRSSYHSGPLVSFSCEFCRALFPSQTKMKQHMLVHSRPVECSFCHKTFPTTSCLTRHLKIHAEIKPNRCPICGKCFADKCNLKSHQAVHDKMVCFWCKLPFLGKKSLLVHQQKECRVVPEISFHHPL